MTRPLAREITGTARVMSGCTTPVTSNSDTALCSTAVKRGNCSGWSTLKLLASRSGSTLALGGASASGLALPELHADNNPKDKQRIAVAIRRLRFEFME